MRMYAVDDIDRKHIDAQIKEPHQKLNLHMPLPDHVAGQTVGQAAEEKVSRNLARAPAQHTPSGQPLAQHSASYTSALLQRSYAAIATMLHDIANQARTIG